MRGLEQALLGKTIEAVRLNRSDLRFPFPEGFVERLTGQQINGFSRRAKYMLWHLSSGCQALMHLGMSGRFVLDSTIAPHDHVVFTIGGREVRYNDPRRFGFMDLVEPSTPNRFLDPLGPEPLGNAFHGTYLYNQLRSRKSSIKACLLNQKIVVGVGNIYGSEALFRAKIRPQRIAANLTKAEAEALSTEVKAVLTEAIAAGGSSIRDYVQADGTLGYFQHTWNVYGREGKPCQICGNSIKRIVQSNRSSFYCRQCQV